MRKSLKHLTPEEKKEYLSQDAKRRYKESVGGRDVRPSVHGLSVEEKLQRRKDKYYKDTEGIKRNKSKKNMTPDELKLHTKAQIKVYNQTQKDKRKEERKERKDYVCISRVSLKGWTDEDKTKRRKELAKIIYRNKHPKGAIKFKKLKPFKFKKLKLVKVKVPKTKSVAENHIPSKKYLHNINLVYEIILSQGTGKTTHKLKMMIYDMTEGINNRFNYKDHNMQHDIKMDAYTYSVDAYDGFDREKYTNAFSYMTEIIKRAHSMAFKKYIKKGVVINDTLYSIRFINEDINEYSNIM